MAGIVVQIILCNTFQMISRRIYLMCIQLELTCNSSSLHTKATPHLLVSQYEQTDSVLPAFIGAFLNES